MKIKLTETITPKPVEIIDLAEIRIFFDIKRKVTYDEDENRTETFETNETVPVGLSFRVEAGSIDEENKFTAAPTELLRLTMPDFPGKSITIKNIPPGLAEKFMELKQRLLEFYLQATNLDAAVE